MVKKLLLIVVVFFVLAGLGIFSICHADMRYYAWTYQFITMPPGEVEIEFYNTMYQPDMNQPEGANWKRQIEVEAGLTERWDISFYLVDSYQASKGKTKFSELKLRTRYKLVSEKGKFIVDPLLYLEYKIQTDRTYPDKWETKLILAKDIGDLNIAVNIIPEETYKKGSKEKEWKTEYAFGMSYPVVVDLFRIGIDSKGDLTNNKHMLGPVISFEGKRIWTAISPIFGLNKKSDDLRVQMIAGIVF